MSAFGLGHLPKLLMLRCQQQLLGSPAAATAEAGYQVAQMLGPQLFLPFLFCGEYYCASHRITAMNVSRQETSCNNLGRLLGGGGTWHILRARAI